MKNVHEEIQIPLNRRSKCKTNVEDAINRVRRRYVSAIRRTSTICGISLIYNHFHVTDERNEKQIQQQNMVAAIAEIIQELIKAYAENRSVNLNSLKTKISGKYGLKTTPRLVDIIAAIPRDAQKYLRPKLLAKPIRTASGVSYFAFVGTMPVFGAELMRCLFFFW